MDALSAWVSKAGFSWLTHTSAPPNVCPLHEDEVYTGLPGGFKMPRVTVYKPNGETLLSTNAKKFEQTKGALILHLEGEHAEVYGATMITTLPYAIQCGYRCDEIAAER
jgi:hypothetical protein